MKDWPVEYQWTEIGAELGKDGVWRHFSRQSPIVPLADGSARLDELLAEHRQHQRDHSHGQGDDAPGDGR